jgi:hypothetical protein
MNFPTAVMDGYRLPRGAVQLDGATLNQGDGAAISQEKALTIRGAQESEILLFDLA